MTRIEKFILHKLNLYRQFLRDDVYDNITMYEDIFVDVEEAGDTQSKRK